MAEIDTAVRKFLALRKIAIVGVSKARDTGCNANYRKFRSAGYRVYPINPHLDMFEGEVCFPDLKSLPERPDGVFILANPGVTDQIVQQCVELGIQHVWMHCLMGTRPGLASGMTSVSKSAVEMCKKHGISVIPGSCPIQFLKPDLGHAMMRGLWRTLGFLRVDY